MSPLVFSFLKHHALYVSLNPTPYPQHLLDDHLCHSLATKCFTANKSLALYTSQCVESRSEREHYSSSNQTRRFVDDTKPLNYAHSEIDASAHIVRCESAHKSIKLRRGRADAKEERNLDEDDEEGARATDTILAT